MKACTNSGYQVIMALKIFFLLYHQYRVTHQKQHNCIFVLLSCIRFILLSLSRLSPVLLSHSFCQSCDHSFPPSFLSFTLEISLPPVVPSFIVFILFSPFLHVDNSFFILVLHSSTLFTPLSSCSPTLTGIGYYLYTNVSVGLLLTEMSKFLTLRIFWLPVFGGISQMYRKSMQACLHCSLWAVGHRGWNHCCTLHFDSLSPFHAKNGHVCQGILYMYQFLCIYVMLLLQKVVILHHDDCAATCGMFISVVCTVLISTRIFHDTECTYMYLEGSRNF